MATKPRRVGVVGGGTMGSGIAITAIRSGHETVLTDVSDGQLQDANGRIVAFLDRSVEKGKTTPKQRQEALNRLTLSASNTDFADCDVVIEAIVEDVDVKRQLFGDLSKVCRDNVVLVTNTSTLSVTAIAAGASDPARVVGMHFCNPAPLMPLVEVVDGLKTSHATAEVAMQLADAMGKTVVRVADKPGFIVNRFLIPFENNCIRLLERGVASVEDIDRAARLGLGHPMGPFTLLDTVGLDVHRAVSLSLYDQLRDPRFAPPPLVDQMIAAGMLGRKTGQGFYTYDAPGMFGA